MDSIKKIFILYVLPVLSGVLLALSALPSKTYYIGFIAFLPLLIAAEATLKKKKPILTFALQVLITIVTFYSIVYFWVLQTANMGFVIGYFIVLPFVFILTPYIVLRKKGNIFSFLYFIAAWMTVEMIQTVYQLGSPFYNLGNNLGANPKIIQWYEFTGSAGGSLWILVTNMVIFSLWKTLLNNRKKWKKQTALVMAVLVVPILVSILILNNYKEKGVSSEVLVIHPSTDNRDVKYRVNIYELMDIYLDIMLPQLTDKTEYVVLPETAITNAGWISDYNRNLVFQHFREKTANYPNLKLITGAVTYENIPNVEKIKDYKKIPGIRYSEKYLTWYYTYNAALQISHKQPTQIRVKEGLVPYQEYAPYPTILPYVSPVGIDFQFSKREKNHEIFIDENMHKTAAFICYEVVLGKLFSKAARQGAEAFFILLNEGWYIDPKVPKQFIQLSVVRAIENRRSIAHSSNMGISAFINQKGEIVDQTKSKQADFLKHKIEMNLQSTFYSKNGNVLGIIVLGIFLIQITGIVFKSPKFQISKKEKN